MKNIILSLCALCSLTAQAQFYSIEDRPMRTTAKTDIPTKENVCSVDVAVVKGSSPEKTETLMAKKEQRNPEYHSSLPTSDLYVSLPLKKLSISSKFGSRTNPITKKGTEQHNGIDLRAPLGTPVYAMLFGEVIKVSYDKRSGKFVTLRHGNYTISYCHLSKQLVSVGQRIMPGEVVGLVGSTGRSTGPHLHITSKYKGKYINPVYLLDFVRKYAS